MNNDFDKELRLKILEPSLIIEGYVKGEDKCNYEKYLIELLNNSQWMRKKYINDFKAPKDQSHGECDAYSDDYGIDFKLIASKTKLQALNLLRPSISKLYDGVTSYGAPKKQGSINATRIFAALRNRTLEDLYRIREIEVKKQGIENDILSFLKTLETQKHLLLFFPYEFFFTSNVEKYAGVKCVIKAVQQDFKQSLLFRELVRPGFDTLFTAIFSDEFLLMNAINGELNLVDTVPTDSCPTYKLLKDYSDIWG